VSLVDVPFQVSIAADSEAAFEFGHIAGAGRAYVNMGSLATWTVDGFGTATVGTAQVYSLPGIAQVGFGWNGEVFPLNTTQPPEHRFDFRASPSALDPDYGHLNAAVPPIPLILLNQLEDPGTVPPYTTRIHFPGQRSLTLKQLSSPSYTVVSVPEPSTGTLLTLALAGIWAGLRMSRLRR
jgi:hypothetical protein